MIAGKIRFPASADSRYSEPMSKLRDHHGKPCPYCRRQMNTADKRVMPTRDHIVPRRNNGKEIIICCLTCNAIKGHMMPEEWAAFMGANPRWWTFSRADLRAARGHRRVLKRGRYPGLRGHGRCAHDVSLAEHCIQCAAATGGRITSGAEQPGTEGIVPNPSSGSVGRI